MNGERLLWLLVLIPAATALAAPLLSTARRILAATLAGALAAAALAGVTAVLVFRHGPLAAAEGWFALDALSAYHLLVLHMVFLLSTLYAWSYFGAEMAQGHFPRRTARIFAALWSAASAAMALVLVSNNIGMMWVGIEATTLLTAFLICLHETRQSLEAMWKYVLICSVGVALAFIGVLLIAVAAREAGIAPETALLWTELRGSAHLLQPLLMKAAFIFLLVGFGTKAGLAPFHNWLPDAHSQAPAPVSALFSGFMLNAALYCILRQLPLVEAATGNCGWGGNLLAGFGLFSIVIAAAFIILQRDLKRFLAYSSVEHIGIIALAAGLGGIGVGAALFHMLNHSLGKTLAFFAAGRLGQKLGTHEMRDMAGTLRVSRAWGFALFGSVLALLGVAPFAIFMSELQLLAAAVARGAWASAIIFLAGAGVIFVGALSHLIPLAWGERAGEAKPDRRLDLALACAPLLALLILGLWLPAPLADMIRAAAAVLGGSLAGQ